MGRRTKVILFFLAAAAAALQPYTLYPQQLRINTFSTMEGLSHNNVRTIASDSSGFLWIATWDGLSRYDGYEFKNYHHLPGRPSSLPYFSVKDLAVDGANNLWVLTDYGHLVRYDRATDGFSEVEDFPFPLTGKNRCIDADSRGDLWIIASSDMIVKRDAHSGVFTEYRVENKYSTGIDMNEDLSVYRVSDSEIWLSGQHLYRLQKPVEDGDSLFILREKISIYDPVKPDPVDFVVRRWSELYISDSGHSWVFSNYGLFRQEPDGAFRKFSGSLPPGELKGDTLFVWQGEGEGISIYDPGPGSLITVPHEEIESNTSFYYHNSSLLWFSNKSLSGNNLGLSKVIIAPDIFNNYDSDVGIGRAEAIFPIYKDEEGVIWTGVRGRNSVLLIKPDGSTASTCELDEKLRLASGHLRAIKPDMNGLWLGYSNELLFYYDRRTKRYTRHHTGSASYQAIDVKQDGVIFIADRQRVFKYFPQQRVTETIWDNDGKPFPPIYCFYPNNKGLLWAGSFESNLIKIDIVNRRAETIQLTEKGYNIEGICEGDRNDLWIALLGGGVCRYNIITGETQFFTTAEGLSNNTTYSVLKDRNGKIWVSTNNGISRIDPLTGFIRIFNQNDGLNIIEFNSDAAFDSGDGLFYFGGMGGIAEFAPDSIEIREKKDFRQRPILTDFIVSGVSKPIGGFLNKADRIVLDKGEDNFHLKISSTDFLNTEKTGFRYRLSGVDRGWVETDWQNRNINYSNLAPGQYQLDIQTTNHESNWSETRSLAIVVQPLFWETRIFRLGLPVLLILVILAMINLYVRQIRQKENQKQNSLRLQSLRGQMNPHFIFNSLNSINYFISSNDKLSANRYIADFSKLIRTILTNLNKDMITLEQETEFITDYLKIEHLRFGDKFDYTINVDRGIGASGMLMAPGMIQPFIENSIWHGIRGIEDRKCLIEIGITMKDGHLEAIISDDGAGRKASVDLKPGKNHFKSRGIAIVEERLKIMNNLFGTSCRFSISDLYPDREQTGTRVIVEIPFMQAGRTDAQDHDMETEA